MTTSTPTATLTAADLMEQHVVTIDPQDTLHEALDLLVDNHLTGLPVVDAMGRCIGVISMSDILTYEQETGHSAAEDEPLSHRYFNTDQQRWEAVGFASIALNEGGTTTVQEVMTGDLISVRPETPAAETAEAMLANDVHRILVLDEAQHLRGIIAAFDFVRLATKSV